MPNIKRITVYSRNLEIKYGLYLIKIYFDFKRNLFKAYTEGGNNLFKYAVEEKRKCLSVIDECLTKVGLKHTQEVLETKQVDYGTGPKEVIMNDPVCYINIGEMLDWITVQKMKGVI